MLYHQWNVLNLADNEINIPTQRYTTATSMAVLGRYPLPWGIQYKTIFNSTATKYYIKRSHITCLLVGRQN